MLTLETNAVVYSALQATNTSLSLSSIVGLVVAAVVGGITGWLGAYAKVKGEGFATRQDFERTLEQVRRNTAAVESVKRQEQDITRRSERTAAYIERQIQEFYGPLFNLVQQIVLANHVQHEILHSQEAERGALTEDQQSEVRRFMQDYYFFPLHHSINEILKTKLYLIEGTRMHSSFYAYLRHALQEETQAKLWRERGIGTRFLPGFPYPNELLVHVQRDLDGLMERYSALTAAAANADGHANSVNSRGHP